MSRSIMNLIARIEDSASADVSLKDVRVLTKSGDPEVIPALAGLLDDDGRVGREAMRGLRAFGRQAEAALRRCLASHDEMVRANAEELLAALGEGTAAEVEELPVPATGNDNDEEVADLTLLSDAEVVRSIRATLHKRGIAGQDLDEGVAEVQTRVLEILRVGAPPQGLAEWRALGNRVAAAFAVDEVRKRYGRTKYEDGLCEDPDVYVDERHPPHWDYVDARRMLGVFVDMAERGELPPLIGKIIGCRAHTMTDIEIAEDLELTRDVVVKRRRIARGTFIWKLQQLGMGELVPKDAQKNDGEAVASDDLPASLPNRRG